MKVVPWILGAAMLLNGCSTPGMQTAWTKSGVSRVDFGTDIGTCAGLASTLGAGSGANTAGGISGQNNAPPMQTPGRDTSPPSGGGPPPASRAATSSSLPAGGGYSGMASTDYAQRAATQQRLQEMNEKRLRTEAYQRCLSEKGYREITLSPEQRRQLAAFPEGSNGRLEYLYSLSAEPANSAPK